jgi:hypothetical protein
MLLNVTSPGLRLQQSSLADALNAVRSRFDPGDTAIVTVTGQDPYRFMMYYLPEYLVVRLEPRAQSVLEARDRHQGTWREVTDCLFAGRPVRRAIWVLSAPTDPGVLPAGATRVQTDDDGPFQVWDLAIGPDTPDYLGFKMGCAASA